MLAASAPYGLAPVLGECGSVGAGLALGGGLGWLSGRYGATCDNLLKADIATSELQMLEANATVKDDLFWAIRGGGGNCGIATSFEYQLYLVKEIIGGCLYYPINKARTVLHLFNEFMTAAPDELQGDCYISGNSCWVTWVYSGNAAQGEDLFNKFRRAVKPERDTLKRRFFSEVYDMEEPVASANYPYGSYKGSYIEHLTNEAIDFVLDCVHFRPATSSVFFVFSHYMHGEVCRISRDVTAFELRDPDAVHLASAVSWQTPSDAAVCIKWHNKIQEQLQAFSGGRIYANYMSTLGGSNAKSVFGSGAGRLQQIKKKYDPDNIFHRNPNILPV